MSDVIEIDGHKAVISYDPDIQVFRGEFVGLNGGADFYATEASGLTTAGRGSLGAFFEVCAARGIDPVRRLAGTPDAESHLDNDVLERFRESIEDSYAGRVHEADSVDAMVADALE